MARCPIRNLVRKRLEPLGIEFETDTTRKLHAASSKWRLREGDDLKTAVRARLQRNSTGFTRS